MTDVAVTLFVALLVFGAMHLPRIADAIGRALRGVPREGAAPQRTDRPDGR